MEQSLKEISADNYILPLNTKNQVHLNIQLLDYSITTSLIYKKVNRRCSEVSKYSFKWRFGNKTLKEVDREIPP